MTKKISKAQLAVLQKERDQTATELEKLRKELSAEIEKDDVDDAASDLIERDKTQAIIFTLQRKLDDIDHAIKNTDHIGYGICEKCGKEIDPERLEIFPEATMCVDCKREAERLSRLRSLSSQQ
jgi:DnaK suppressor protein